MPKSEYTKGPWKIFQNANFVDSAITGQTIAVAVLSGRYGDQGMTLDQAEQERKANARLIAAAPELLEALKAVESHHALQNALKGRPEEQSHTLAIVREAIAKAEGK